jgi:hypothetical protein
LELRIQAVVALRLDGAEGWDVRQYVAEKQRAGEAQWKIPPGGKPLSDRQIRNYVEAADKVIADSCRASRKHHLRRHLAQRRMLFARAVQARDLRTALAILQDLATMQDLYPPKRVEGKHEQQVSGRASGVSIYLPHNGREVLASPPVPDPDGETAKGETA